MRSNDAVSMAARKRLSEEGCALSMEQRSNDAVAMDVQIRLRKEECASSMEQRSSTNDAAVMDARIMLRKEERARGMEQRSNYAARKDAQTKYNEEGCAVDMGHFAILLTNPLHLLHHIDQLTMKRLQLFPIFLLPQLLPTKSMEFLLV